MPVGSYTITATSKPVYDGWGYDTFWGCEHWVAWHKALRKKFKKDHADLTFLQAWSQNGLGSAALDCRTFNSSFKGYFKSVGLLDTLQNPISSALSATVSVAQSGTNIATNAASGVEKFSQVFFKLLPWLLLIILFFIGLYFYKKYFKK